MKGERPQRTFAQTPVFKMRFREGQRGVVFLMPRKKSVCFFRARAKKTGTANFGRLDNLRRLTPFRVAPSLAKQDVVAADIRACVEFARKKYKPTSLGLMGFCYGGGRALEEAAAGEVMLFLRTLV